MSDLTIDRLTASVHLPELDDAVAARVHGLLRAATGDPFDAAVRDAGLPDGIWCVRRIDAPVRLDLARTDAALAQTWAAALGAAVAGALAGRGEDVVRYRSASDAVVDLSCALAAGRAGRAWAWRAAGILRDGDPDPVVDPGAALLAVTARHPEIAVPAVVAAAASAGIAPLHRMLGAAGWVAVARTVDGREPAAINAASTAARPGAVVSESGEMALAVRLAERLVTSSRFVEAVRRGRVRPDAVTAAAWSRIVAAEANPTTRRRPAAPAVLARIEALLTGRASAIPATPATPGVMMPRPSISDPHRVMTSTADAAPSRHTRPAVDESSSADDDPTHPTAWAGLLFLLATAEAAGVPDDVVADPRLAARPLPWVLRRVAAAVGVPPDDPASAVFAGAEPGRPEPPSETATPTEAAAVTDLVDRWSEATATVLDQATAVHRDDRNATFLQHPDGLLRRPGLVSWSPGWAEIAMPLDSVDLDVRRAGLDLDPGWVPWLGLVVRYRYG